MRRAAWSALLALVLLCFMVAATSRGEGEILLFDAPKGAWLGTLRDDAPLTILEERDGWKHVRLEGWVKGAAVEPAAAGGDEAVAGGSDAKAEAAPVAAPAAPATAPGATLKGVLAPPIQTGGAAGTGVLVLLVGESGALDGEHRKAGAECRARVERKDRDIEASRKEANRALNSSDNFRDAASRNDQAKSQLAREQRERQDLIRDCRSRAQAVFEPSVVGRAISDGSGRFEFEKVAPGRYRVVAFETTGDAPRTWSFSCDVGAVVARVLDPITDRSPVPADWDLK
jgi:hypothetical protein